MDYEDYINSLWESDPIICPDCGGTGELSYPSRKCKTCKGTGYIDEESSDPKIRIR